MIELISVAAAAPTAAQQQQSPMSLLVMFALLALFMWFFLFRPQRKQRQEHARMLAELKTNDEVLTSGGIYGRVTDIQRNWVMVEVTDKICLRVQKNAILSVLPRGSLDAIDDQSVADGKKDKGDSRHSDNNPKT